MQATPHRSDAEVRANSAFDALLWALGRPGLARHLPSPGEGSVIEALLDRECQAHCADPLLIPQIMRTGAAIADIGAADHIFLGHMSTASLLADIRTGTDLYPDEGATVVVRATIGRGTPLRLSGPGVNGSVHLAIGGLPDGFWQARARRIRYPMGFDLFLLDSAAVIGIPRSTTVEVL